MRMTKEEAYTISGKKLRLWSLYSYEFHIWSVSFEIDLMIPNIAILCINLLVVNLLQTHDYTHCSNTTGDGVLTHACV